MDTCNTCWFDANGVKVSVSFPSTTPSVLGNDFAEAVLAARGFDNQIVHQDYHYVAAIRLYSDGTIRYALEEWKYVGGIQPAASVIYEWDSSRSTPDFSISTPVVVDMEWIGNQISVTFTVNSVVKASVQDCVSCRGYPGAQTNFVIGVIKADLAPAPGVYGLLFGVNSATGVFTSGWSVLFEHLSYKKASTDPWSLVASTQSINGLYSYITEWFIYGGYDYPGVTVEDASNTQNACFGNYGVRFYYSGTEIPNHTGLWNIWDMNVYDFSISASPSTLVITPSLTSTVSDTVFLNLNQLSGSYGYTLRFAGSGAFFSSITPSCEPATGASPTVTFTVPPTCQTIQVTSTATITATPEIYPEYSQQRTVAITVIIQPDASSCIDGNVGGACNYCSNGNLALTLTTTRPNDIILAWAAYAAGTSVAFTISDSAGLMWNLRVDGSGNYRYWYAVSSIILSSDVITIHGGQSFIGQAFGVKGANFNSPFDSGFPLQPSKGSCTTSCSATVTTTTSNDLLIALTTTDSNNVVPTQPSGFAQLNNGLRGGFSGTAADNRLSGIVSSQTFTWTLSQSQHWDVFIIDAIVPYPG